jgi:hypothetical protein
VYKLDSVALLNGGRLEIAPVDVFSVHFDDYGRVVFLRAVQELLNRDGLIGDFFGKAVEKEFQYFTLA